MRQSYFLLTKLPFEGQIRLFLNWHNSVIIGTTRIFWKGRIDKMYKLAHLALVVKDCKRSADFYRQVLGCTVINHASFDTLKIIYLHCGEMTIELLEYITAAPGARSLGVYDHLAFTVNDLSAAIVSLKEQGLTFETDIPRLTMNEKKIIFFAGPDGERIELMES